jgi:hypothetical protein
LTVNLFELFGSYYNGPLNEARVRATYRASERLSFNFAEQWNHFALGATADPFINPLLAGSGNFSVWSAASRQTILFRFLTLSTLL